MMRAFYLVFCLKCLQVFLSSWYPSDDVETAFSSSWIQIYLNLCRLCLENDLVWDTEKKPERFYLFDRFPLARRKYVSTIPHFSLKTSTISQTLIHLTAHWYILIVYKVGIEICRPRFLWRSAFSLKNRWHNDNRFFCIFCPLTLGRACPHSDIGTLFYFSFSSRRGREFNSVGNFFSVDNQYSCVLFSVQIRDLFVV